MKKELETISSAIVNGCGKQAIIRALKEVSILSVRTVDVGYKLNRTEVYRLTGKDAPLPVSIGDYKELSITDIAHLTIGGEVYLSYAESGYRSGLSKHMYNTY